jgi:hypothetical protein
MVVSQENPSGADEAQLLGLKGEDKKGDDDH